MNEIKRDRVKIDIEIYIVFIVLIGVSVFNAIYSTIIISQNQRASTKIMSVDVPSMQALENMNLLVTRSKMHTTNWVYLQGDREDKAKLRALQDYEYPELSKRLFDLMTKWNEDSNRDSLMSICKKFDELIISERKIMNTLVTFDDYEDPMKKFGATEILETQVLPQSALIMSRLDRVILKRKAFAEVAHHEMIESSRNLMWSVLSLAVLIVLIVLMAGFYFSNRIIVPVMKLRNYILRMGKGELPDIMLVTGKNAVGQMIAAVKTLKGNLKQTARFANKIGEGDFKAEFEPLGDGDVLGNALIQMRENLRKASEELFSQSELLRESREDLKRSNKELVIKADLLQVQNQNLEEVREALSTKAKELEQISKYKSEFLANMSHELRTPLNSLLILAKLLVENKNNHLNEKESEYARVIYKSGSDLLALINDILDLSKIEAGKIEIVMQKARIATIKGDMLDLFSPVANEKKIEFLTEIHSDLPNEFITDQFRLEQVLKNLLSNAFKFTSKGGRITLKIKKLQNKQGSPNENSSRQFIEFSVHDTGTGIPKDKQHLIFEAFQQADGSTSRKYGGTGLGLSISKMLVDKLGGEITLESELGKGSSFYVIIPLEGHPIANIAFDEANSSSMSTSLPPTNSQQAPIMPDHVDKSKEVVKKILPPAQNGSATPAASFSFNSEPLPDIELREKLKGKTALIANSDMRVNYGLIRILQSLGIDAIIATTIDETMSKISFNKVDFMFIEFLMAGKESSSAIQEIRKKFQQAHFHIFVILDKVLENEENIIDKVVYKGADNFICLPVNARQVMALLKTSFLNVNIC